MHTRSVLTYAALWLLVLATLGLLVEAEEARRLDIITLNFETAIVGQLPAGFSTAVTGGGGPAAWAVIEEPTAPGGGKVLAQTSAPIRRLPAFPSASTTPSQPKMYRCLSGSNPSRGW